MKKTAVLSILVFVFAIATGVLGYLYSTKMVEKPEAAESAQLPISEMTDKWASSAHADSSSLAFRDWDETEDKKVPPTCAKCHSSSGLKDYFGLDGTAVMAVDNPAKIGNVVDCSACHNSYVETATTVKFPSGIEMAAASDVVPCWTCHQGMQGGINGDLDKKIGSTEPDAKAEGLGFVNPHYLAVGSMYLGSEANGGYQYEGKTYAGHFEHAEGVQSCTECHDPHSLHLADPGYKKCQTCHAEVTAWPDQQKIRRTKQDYDGDGDVTEPTYDEINGLTEKLIAAIVQYSKDISKAPIGYTPNYPYWFADLNENGTQDEGEAGYKDWTPRMMRAAFNYKFVSTSAGYIHNPVYSAQLLIDSISDLASGDSAIALDKFALP